jgi:hypothetical protein
MSRRKAKCVPIHGWLCVDKPTGMTSTHVVNVIRVTSVRRSNDETSAKRADDPLSRVRGLW